MTDLAETELDFQRARRPEQREARRRAILGAVADWLDELPAELPPGPPAVVTEALARSLAARPLICELWSALGTQLERNISAEAVRDFKLANAENQAYLAELLRVRVQGWDLAA